MMTQDCVKHLCICAIATCLFLVEPLRAADSRSVAEAASDELIRQDFAALAKRFSPQMRAAVPEDRMAAQLGSAVKSLGPLRGAQMYSAPGHIPAYVLDEPSSRAPRPDR